MALREVHFDKRSDIVYLFTKGEVMGAIGSPFSNLEINCKGTFESLHHCASDLTWQTQQR